MLSVRKGSQVVIAGDGQVTLGNTVIKANARKVRRLGKGGVIAGFAGATADAFTLRTGRSAARNMPPTASEAPEVDARRLPDPGGAFPCRLVDVAVQLEAKWRAARH